MARPLSRSAFSLGPYVRCSIADDLWTSRHPRLEVRHKLGALVGKVVFLSRIALEVVELDEVVGRTNDQLVWPLHDRPLQLLLDRVYATGGGTQRGGRPEHDRCQVEAVERHVHG